MLATFVAVAVVSGGVGGIVGAAIRGDGGSSSAVVAPSEATKDQGFLGVRARDARGDARGAEIVEVTNNSPADRIGLRPGDVITAVDDQRVTSASGLNARIRAHRPSDQVTITYRRNGSSAHVRARLGNRGVRQRFELR